MIHLLLRIDPSFIRRDPYVPTANFLPGLRALEVGLKLNPRALVFCVPGIASYVGGDTTSGVLSVGQDRSQELALLIDIGTNGEVALGNKEFLVATSASAGPAFEGSGVRSGMRSSQGAIQKVSIQKDGQVRVQTIGGAAPRGICGSGYIDAIAEMLAAGLLDRDGKIRSVDQERVRMTETGKEFVLVPAARSANGSDIVISEADIDNIKRAKAAIYAACTVLLRRMSVDFADVRTIFIAGGFGTSLGIKNAIRIGLLPDLDPARFVFVGNSSLAGARQMILSQQAFDAAGEIARKMAYLELSTEPSYMDEYMAALFFPHTDLARFSSLR